MVLDDHINGSRLGSSRQHCALGLTCFPHVCQWNCLLRIALTFWTLVFISQADSLDSLDNFYPEIFHFITPGVDMFTCQLILKTLERSQLLYYEDVCFILFLSFFFILKNNSNTLQEK